MKKVKIMLLSLTLLAIVGGALAFKAKTVFKYCTTLAIEDGEGVLTCGLPVTTCPDEVSSTITASPNDVATFVCYTSSNTYTTAAGERMGCAYNTDNWQQGQFGTSVITCATTQKLKRDQ